jgi:hypothetical protein
VKDVSQCEEGLLTIPKLTYQTGGHTHEYIYGF